METKFKIKQVIKLKNPKPFDLGFLNLITASRNIASRDRDTYLRKYYEFNASAPPTISKISFVIAA